jgi:transmembrane sensor
MMNNSRLEFLFHRYLSGSCTQEETLELIQYLNESNNPQVKHLLNELWNHSSERLPAEKAEQILNSILAQPKKIVPLHRKRYAWARAAAVIGFIALSGAAYYQFNHAPSSGNVMQPLAENLQHHQYVKLPDGSTVILNSDSKLEYANSFTGTNTREVYLTGEGFFDIRHDDAKPFVVHTGKISTTVLGTAFNVKAYPEQNDITVTVTRGKVKVSDEVKLLGILIPDEQIIFHKSNHQARQEKVKSIEVIEWIENDIFFDDVSMLEAAKQLEERFHVKITFKNDNIKNCKFTATFIRGEDLHQILDVICEFNQAKYTADESGDIQVSGNGCSF